MLNTTILTLGGRPRRELLAFLQSVPGLELSCFPLHAPDNALPPGLTAADLLIVDVPSHDYDDWSMLKAARARWPHTRCLALVSTPRQIEGALTSGAERVLLAGFSTIELFEALQDMGLIKDILNGPL